MKKKKESFTIISNAFLRHGTELGLNDSDKMTYITVKMHKWDDDPAYPSSKRIAELRDVSERNVELSSVKMQELVYLSRPKGGRKPTWDFSQLDEILEGITGGDFSLLEDAKKRVEEYVTAKKTRELERKRKGLTAKKMTINSEKNYNLTPTFSSPEEDLEEDSINNTKLNNNETKELVSSFLLKKNQAYYKDKQKNEKRRKLLSDMITKIQGVGK